MYQSLLFTVHINYKRWVEMTGLLPQKITLILCNKLWYVSSLLLTSFLSRVFIGIIQMYDEWLFKVNINIWEDSGRNCSLWIDSLNGKRFRCLNISNPWLPPNMEQAVYNEVRKKQKAAERICGTYDLHMLQSVLWGKPET